MDKKEVVEMWTGFIWPK